MTGGKAMTREPKPNPFRLLDSDSDPDSDDFEWPLSVAMDPGPPPNKINWKRKYEESIKENDEQKKRLRAELSEKNRTIEEQEKLRLDLEERVRCPVCLEVPTAGPIYSCPSGHCIWSTCYQGPASNCPMCRTTMARSTSLLGMTVIENIKHACRLEGCNEKMLLDQVEKHNKACNYRQVTCPAIFCEEKITYNHVKDHTIKECEMTFKEVVDVNNGAKIRLQAFNAKDPKAHYAMNMFKWKGQHFFLSQKWREDGKFKNFYMQMLGTEEECSKYKVSLALNDGPYGLYSNKVSDHPYPIDMEEADKDDAGLIVSEKTMKAVSKPKAGVPNTYKFSLIMDFYEVE
jgi:hypothetical protein